MFKVRDNSFFSPLEYPSQSGNNPSTGAETLPQICDNPSAGVETFPQICDALSAGVETFPQIRDTLSAGVETFPQICDPFFLHSEEAAPRAGLFSLNSKSVSW